MVSEITDLRHKITDLSIKLSRYNNSLKLKHISIEKSKQQLFALERYIFLMNSKRFILINQLNDLCVSKKQHFKGKMILSIKENRKWI